MDAFFVAYGTGSSPLFLRNTDYDSMTPPPGSTVSGVTLAPAALTLAASAAKQFVASVQGTNSPLQAVTWSSSAGQVSTAGLFIAPAATLAEQKITVTATSVQDPSKSASAVVTIPAASSLPSTVTGVVVSPQVGDLKPGEHLQMSALVLGTNSPDQEVTWSADVGQITAGGLYTAPLVASADMRIAVITATSVQDPTKDDIAQVVILATEATPPTPTPEGKRTVAVTIMAVDQQGNYMSGAPVSIMLDKVDIDPSFGYVAPEEFEANADENGKLVVNLWPNVLGKLDSRYQFKITNPDTGKCMRVSAAIPNFDCVLHKIATNPQQ
jgi:hypothetical protein